MSSTKSQVAVATNIPNIPSSNQPQQQKDYNSEESLGRQNSFGMNRRGTMKGKHLTRSHAMREATSPPRTPTPRASESSSQSQMSPNGYQQQQSATHHHHVDVSESNNNNSNNNNKLHTQSSATRGNSPIIDTPSVIVTSQHKQQQLPQQTLQQQQQQQQHTNVALCNETEFPKLSPPKSKGGGGGTMSGGGSGSSGHSSNGQQQQQPPAQRSNSGSSSSTNNNNGEGTPNSNKKTNGDASGSINDTHNKATSNIVNTNSVCANKGYSQSQQQQQQTQQSSYNAGSALQKALKISDNSQQQSHGTSSQATQNVYNSPMNYQLHPNDGNHQQQQQQQPTSYIVYDKENRCPRNDSQNSVNSSDEIHFMDTQQSQQHHSQQQHHQQQQQSQHHQRSGGSKKHRTNSNSKGSKPRLKNIGGGSSTGGNASNNGSGGATGSGCGGGGGVTGGPSGGGSIDGSLNSSNNTSGFISRENSNEQYTDHGGTDLLSFFKETLNKNVKDRQFLLKVEKDLIEFVQEGSRGEIRFPQASSYNRMLIHRTAAFFGMEHNVDTETQQCVIVAPTKNTRIPDIRFKTLVIHNRDDSRKSILKRDTHSFDEARQSSYLCPDRGGMLDRKAKSFEEREEDYDRARSRIFNRSQNEACGGSTDDDNNYISWTSSVDQQQFSRGRSGGKVIKIQNSPDGRVGNAVPKGGSSYSSYGSSQSGAPLMRGDSVNSNKGGGGGGNGGGATGSNNNRQFSKQDSIGSTSTSWRLSPSSSGYKTQTQSVHSESVTPSPTGGYGSDEHTPDHSSVIANRENIDATTSPPCGLVWAVTDISNVPKGSVLINPQTLQPILNSDGTVYHFDPSNPPPTQAMSAGGNGGNGGGGSSSSGMYHSAPNNTSPQQQQGMHSIGKKQHKGHQMSQTQQQQQQHQKCQQQFHPVDSTPPPVGVESVSESSTQTVNECDEALVKNVSDINYLDGGDLSNKDDNDECDNSANGCLSITTTTSTKNYDRIEVQKFKNQATSPNIPLTEKEDLAKFEHTGQAPSNVVTPSQQQQQPPNRETPHSARSTPFSNSDTVTKRSSEEPRTTSWTQSYQAPDGSTVFHTNTTPNGSNPYCTTTYQQAPDGSIYAVPQGMIYAYPPPVEGEFQGYFMPVFDPSQQRGESTGILQPGTQTIYPTSGTATMVPVAAYPTAQFTTTNGTPIYPGQVIYSGEQFQTAGAQLTAAAPASTTGQLQQIPMTTYPIGYPYPYNGYWGQTMTYYVPQQAVPATSLLTAQAPPQAAPTAGAHVAGGVNTSGPNGLNSAAGPSMNPSNINNATGASGGCTQNINHPNGPAPSGYQPHGNTGTIVGGGGSNHNSGTTYYGTGRIKRPNPSHFSSSGAGGGHQVLTTTTLPNGVSATTYQLGHAVPTLTLAATAPAPASAGAPATSDLSAAGATSATATMYALPQHATIFPANMFPYATNAAPALGHQPTAASMAQQAALISQHGNPQVPTHAVSGHPTAAAAGAMHNPHHSNTVITPFYTTTHHHNPHAGIPTAAHAIHAPGPAAIPIVDPASLINAAQNGPGSNPYIGRGGGGIGIGGNSNSTSQSAPSTPHSMPSAPHHSQRNPPVFSTPPIMNNNVGHYNSASSTPHYYGGAEQNHQSGGGNCSNSPHNSYPSTSYEKRNNGNGGGGGKKSLPYQSASLSRQNSSNAGGYNSGGGKPSSLLGNNNNSNNDTRASPGSNSTNPRPHSMKRSGGGNASDKPQTPLLSGPPSFPGGANISNNSYPTTTNVEMATGVVPIVNVAKPPVRLNAAAAAFRHKSSASTGGGGAGGNVVENRRNPASQRNSPSTNASSSNDNSNNNSPNSIQNSSNAATPIAAGCYAPSYMINAQNSGGEAALPHHPPPSLYITTATARGPAHIPPHLQSAAGGAAVSASAVQAAAAASTGIPQQATTAVLGGAAAAAAAADVANAAAVAAAATVAHHHHPQPLLGTYNPGASGLYFKYGHTYFAHPSVALPNSRRSPSTDMRPPIAQVAGMYPTMNMMIPAQPRHPGRHPNPNYKGTRPR